MKSIWLFSIVITSAIYAQFSDYSVGLGVAGGLVSGSGLSYRNVGESKGIQFTFGIMSFPYEEDEYSWSDERTGEYGQFDWTPDTTQVYREYNYGNGGTWGNMGLVFLKPLHRADKSMFYLLGGVSVYYTSTIDKYRDYRYTILSDSTYSYTAASDLTEDKTSDYTFRVGLGIGLEYAITENIRLSLDLPLTVSDRKEITMIIPEAGLYYYFK